MCHECEAALLNEIGLHGITEYKIERHGSHRTLLFTFREKPIRLVFGVNPSDRHHLQNALRDLRREMGVKRIIDKRPGDRRRAAPRLRRPTEAVTLPKLTAPPRPDPWAALRALAAARPVPDATEPEPAAPTSRIRLPCPQFGRRPRWQETP